MTSETPSTQLGPEQVRLDAALEERDAALTALARVQAELDQLRLQLLSADEPEPPNYPASAEPGNPPLRYLMVDEVHSAVKRLGTLPGLRQVLRRGKRREP